MEYGRVRVVYYSQISWMVKLRLALLSCEHQVRIWKGRIRCDAINHNLREKML